MAKEFISFCNSFRYVLFLLCFVFCLFFLKPVQSIEFEPIKLVSNDLPYKDASSIRWSLASYLSTYLNGNYTQFVNSLDSSMKQGDYLMSINSYGLYKENALKVFDKIMNHGTISAVDINKYAEWWNGNHQYKQALWTYRCKFIGQKAKPRNNIDPGYYNCSLGDNIYLKN
jgi:hypothetical protein